VYFAAGQERREHETRESAIEKGDGAGEEIGSRGDANAKMDNDVHQGGSREEGREGARGREAQGDPLTIQTCISGLARLPREAREKERERENGREGLTDSRDFVLLKPAFSFHANFKFRR